MASSNSQQSIAILDDYAGIAPQLFTHIENLKVDTFPETLDPKDPAQHDALIERLKPYTIISTMRERTPMPGSLIKSLPNLKLLLTTGVRNASLDLFTCKERSIIIAGTTGTRPAAYDTDGNPIHSTEPESSHPPPPPPPGYDSTTQHAWSLLLSLTSRIAYDNARLHTTPSSWQSGLTIPLGGRVVGILGLGKLGTTFARIAHAFGMKVIAWSESLTQEKADAAAAKAGIPTEAGGIKAVSKEDLFKLADVVSIHYVLSDRSRGIVGAKELGSMKKSALLVNTARGPLIDETALLKALSEGWIRGAALDVYWQEPLPEKSVWRTTEWGQEGRSEVVLSPHMGYVNGPTMRRWYEEQAENVGRWIRDEGLKNRIDS